MTAPTDANSASTETFPQPVPFVVCALERSKPSSSDCADQKTSRPQQQVSGNWGKDTCILHRLGLLYDRTCCIYVCRLYARPWRGNQDLLRNKGIAPCVSWTLPPLKFRRLSVGPEVRS